MEIITKVEKDIDSYIELGLNTFLLPVKDYSIEYSNYYSLEDIETIVTKYPNINIFVSMNRNIENEELEDIKSIMIKLNKLKIKGIFFYDACFIKLKQDLGLDIDLVWSSTHMVTNYRTCDYYYNQNVKYALLSKEITEEEILEIINKSKINKIVELISMPVIATSKRKLVSNYYENYNMEKKDKIEVKEKVSDTDLLIKEDKNGVFFVKENIINGFYILDDLLKNKLDYILVKEDFIDHDLFVSIIKDLIYYINNYDSISDEEKKSIKDKWLNKIGEDSGFFFKKTIYRVKK